MRRQLLLHDSGADRGSRDAAWPRRRLSLVPEDASQKAGVFLGVRFLLDSLLEDGHRDIGVAHGTLLGLLLLGA